MRLDLAYGTGRMGAELDWGRVLATLDVADAPVLADLDGHVRRALCEPIGMWKGLFDRVRPGDRVTILVSDSFRKTCIEQVLPVLIRGLNGAGIRDADIAFLFATGTHRPPTLDEQRQILGGPIFERFKDQAYVHDPCDKASVVYVGTTSRGTRVEVNRKAIECDRLIATGAVVLHYFGGFGGGRKSIVPGIASVATIAHNHAMNLHPERDDLDPAVRIGVLDGNPVAEDMLEGSRFIRVDFIVNTVLNRRGEIAGVFGGELNAAHRAAAAFATDLYAVPIEQRADVVIGSSGATRNYVQSHKALYNCYQAVKPGGRMILLARCEEGLGGEQFAKWVRLGSREAIIAGLRKHSEINGQTALSTVEKAPITVFVTDLSAEDAALLGGRKAASLDEALEMVRKEVAAEPTVYLMPNAAYTVPVVTKPAGPGGV